jgi:hypothetical protein
MVRAPITTGQSIGIGGWGFESPRVLVWDRSSFGRALSLHLRGEGFESLRFHHLGAVAHLGERLRGTQEVVGSIPISSTRRTRGGKLSYEFIRVSSNGRTAVSEAVYRGSNPCTRANPMSRSKNKKRQRMPSLGKEDPAVSAVQKRHTFGRTEKILRRNRKTWTRLGNKRRRQADKTAASEPTK